MLDVQYVLEEEQKGGREVRQACGWIQQSLVMISLVGHLQYQLAQLSHKPAAPICLDACAHSAALNTPPS